MLDLSLQDVNCFLPSIQPQIYLLDTDINEPELLVRTIAVSAFKEQEELFLGDSPYVFVRLRYTPPYEKNMELKKLITQIRQASGLRSEFRGMIFIDPSEYKGHEGEEFFVILLKYLYDNAAHCSIIMTCCQYSDSELSRLNNSCMRFFPVIKKNIHLFDRGSLVCLLGFSFQEARISCDLPAIRLIAELLESPKLRDYRNLQLIKRIPFEISKQSAVRKTKVVADPFHRHAADQAVTRQDVEDYFRRPESTICMMAGHALFPRTIQEKGHEHSL